MSQVTNFAPPRRVVVPRTREYPCRPIVAVVKSDYISEDGEVGTIDELAESLPHRPPTIFAAMGGAGFVGQLDDVYRDIDPAHWQWRAATHERDILRPNGFRFATRISTVIHYFGFKGGNYHKAIDPIAMYGRSLDTLWPGDEPVIVRLLKWAIAVRDFCHENNIEIKPTIGSISSQFLTDRRFYPNPRRKVPAATNDTVREQLPGNHYDLNVIPDPDGNYTAHYLDQHRAHHHHAQMIALPDADTLYAYGRFTDLDAVAFDHTVPNFQGLYCLDLEPPLTKPAFSWINHQCLEKQFVYSNELQHLFDMGYKVTGVRAAWGSVRRDTGLSKFAQWAWSQLDAYGDPPWLKPLLLSTYGVLATRPKQTESVFRLAKGGEQVGLLTGKYQLNGKLTKGHVKLEPRIANVLHRGMIEAATRSESVGLAQWLNSQGHQILSIYADAVIVEADDDKPLPILPEPWRSKQQLSHLQFISQQAFMSDGMTKLPGVGREIIQYRQHRTPGYAPRVVLTEAVTNQQVQTNRRI